MISFPNIKINIGLDILRRRTDGYHDIESIFYPIKLNDILEILPSDKFEIINKGIPIDCKIEDNLCYKAWKIIDDKHKIGNVKIILYKNIPLGSGLGAGSSNATFTLKMLNEIYNLNDHNLIEYASQIGADCAFFVENKPAFVSGIGTNIKTLNIDLSGYYIMLCFPNLPVNTKNAYKNCTPYIPEKRLNETIKLPIETWKENIKNDFEKSIFKQYPIIKEIKDELYTKGAIYAQMSGSGSSVYGIFKDNNKDICLKSCKQKVCIEM